MLTVRQISSAIGIANQMPISPTKKGKVNNGIKTNIIERPQEINADSKGFSIEVWKLLEIILINDSNYANVKKNTALFVKLANSLFPLEKRWTILSPKICITMNVIKPIEAPDFKAIFKTSLILSILLAPKL